MGAKKKRETHAVLRDVAEAGREIRQNARPEEDDARHERRRRRRCGAVRRAGRGGRWAGGRSARHWDSVPGSPGVEGRVPHFIVRWCALAARSTKMLHYVQCIEGGVWKLCGIKGNGAKKKSRKYGTTFLVNCVADPDGNK